MDLYLWPTFVQEMAKSRDAEIAHGVFCSTLRDGIHDSLRQTVALHLLHDHSNHVRLCYQVPQRVLTSVTVAHHPLTASKSARPQTQTKPISILGGDMSYLGGVT